MTMAAAPYKQGIILERIWAAVLLSCSYMSTGAIKLPFRRFTSTPNNLLLHQAVTALWRQEKDRISKLFYEKCLSRFSGKRPFIWVLPIETPQEAALQLASISVVCDGYFKGQPQGRPYFPYRLSTALLEFRVSISKQLLLSSLDLGCAGAAYSTHHRQDDSAASALITFKKSHKRHFGHRRLPRRHCHKTLRQYFRRSV